MSAPRPYVPHCVGCSRPQAEVDFLFSIRDGGMPVYICFDCIDELHAKAWLERRKPTAEPHLRLVEDRGDA